MGESSQQLRVPTFFFFLNPRIGLIIILKKSSVYFELRPMWRGKKKTNCPKMLLRDEDFLMRRENVEMKQGISQPVLPAARRYY